LDPFQELIERDITLLITGYLCTNTVIGKLEEFFKSQIEKGKIRQVDARVLAGMCFSITFQSIILWNVYDMQPSVETEKYAKNFLDILYHGIKV
jgi:hypothetical protein